MTEISELLFEMSSETRLEIIKEIKINPSNQTNIAKTLDISVQEASRHITRLSDTKIIEKDRDNICQITGFGNVLLSVLPTMEFFVKNDDYFVNHNLDNFPPEFLYRMGDLLDSEYSNFVSDTFRHVEQVFDESKKFVWAIADQPLISNKSILSYLEKQEGVSLKILIKKDNSGDLKHALKDRIEIRYCDNPVAGMILNEKIAGVVFKGKNNALDFSSGFGTTSEKSYKWCYDFFRYCWGQNKN